MSNIIDPFKPDPNAPTMQEWIGMIGKVNECWAEMQMLHHKYGDKVYACAIDFESDELPEEMRKFTMSCRYLNSRLKEGHKA